jgi:hypothetical protein
MYGKECEKKNCALWVKEITIDLSTLGLPGKDFIEFARRIVGQLSPIGLVQNGSTIKQLAHCSMRDKGK